MKNLKKIIFCVFFSAFCLFSAFLLSSNGNTFLFPSVYASESGTWGDNITWILDDKGVLTVSGTGEMQSSTDETPFPWSEHSTLIKKVVIDSGITSIASDAFYRCEAITELTVSENVTTINSYAFYYCASLANVSLPENSSLVNIAASSFAQCGSLEYIFIPSSVIKIGGSAFSGSSLKTVDIPEDSKLETIGAMAFSGTDIESFHIPASAKSVDSMTFMSASMLKEITVSENNKYYTSIDGVLFRENNILVHYPAAKTDNEYTIPMGTVLVRSHAFYKNQNIVTLNIPNTVTSIEKNCCQYMNSLEYVNFEAGIQLKTITEYAFANNTLLKEIIIPSSVITIETYAFGSCTNVQKIIFDDNAKIETVGSYAFSRIYGIIEDIIIPATVKTIKDGAFYQCNLNGNSIILPEDGLLETIGSLAFDDVRFFESIFYIPPTVKSIGSSAFHYLKTVYYGGSEEQWNEISIDENNEELFNAEIIFDYNSSLYKNITVEKNGTVMVIEGSGATPSSTNPSYRPWNENREDTTAVVISGEISVLGKNSFADFSELTYIIIRSPNILIEDGAFNNCPKLETVIILGNSNFSENSFVGCAENIRIFEEKSKQHTFTVNTGNISIVPFSYSENILTFEEELSLDSYEFFDIVSVFATEYENIEKLKFSSFLFEDIVLYRYNEETMSRDPIDNNTLTNGEIYPETFIDGEIKAVSFNELCEGMANGSITEFFLITVDENNGKIENTQVEIVEQLRNFILRAIRWVVTLMNKLFRVLKSFFG